MAAIFISYARRDGSKLALQLKDDLRAAGHNVWLDTSDVHGGDSWSQNIEDAIEHSDITIALLSHYAFNSEICRAEQLRSLRKGKRLIPLLIQVDAERPLYLEHLNYRDISDYAQYDTVFSMLLEDIATGTTIDLPKKRQNTLVAAPALPVHFIPRPEDFRKLSHAVVSDETKGALTALVGLGGGGKSVLAAALCQDEVIQAAFPDGIVWISVGREPGDLLKHMKFIGEKLGDSPSYYTQYFTDLRKGSFRSPNGRVCFERRRFQWSKWLYTANPVYGPFG